MTMLRLNPTTLSRAFGQQLIDEGAYLRPSFENELLPVICNRLNDPTPVSYTHLRAHET